MEMCRFTQGQAVSEANPGGKFMLYDGMITGTYTNLEENKSIGMQWRMKDWNDDEYSQVIISLTAEGNNTEVKVF